MKHVLTITFTLMLALVMQAQTTVTFMGVPVKGDYESFKQELLKKGCYTDKNNLLKGVVDGALSTIIIKEKHDVVVSVTAIEIERLKNENDAVSRYNYLIDYYRERPDYTEYESNPYINDTEQATIQKYIGSEWYYAEFFQSIEPQRYTRRMGIKISGRKGDYRIVRLYDNNYDIDKKLP